MADVEGLTYTLSGDGTYYTLTYINGTEVINVQREINGIPVKYIELKDKLTQGVNYIFIPSSVEEVTSSLFGVWSGTQGDLGPTLIETFTLEGNTYVNMSATGLRIRTLTLGKGVSINDSFSGCEIGHIVFGDDVSVNTGFAAAKLSDTEITFGRNFAVTNSIFGQGSGNLDNWREKQSSVTKIIFREGYGNSSGVIQLPWVSEIVYGDNCSVGDSQVRYYSGETPNRKITVGNNCTISKVSYSTVELHIGDNCTVAGSTGPLGGLIETFSAGANLTVRINSLLKDTPLTEFSIGENCNIQGAYTLQGTLLESVTIPDGCTIDSVNTFYNMNNLKTVVIGNNCVLGEDQFSPTSPVESITIGDNFEWVRGVVPTSVKRFSVGNNCTLNTTMPSGLTNFGSGTSLSVGANFMSSCPDAVVSVLSFYKVGRSAFSGCSGVVGNYTFEDGTVVEASAFNGCGSMDAAIFKGSATLKQNSFSGTSVTSLDFPSTSALYSNPFQGCNITSCTFGDSVTTSGGGFAGFFVESLRIPSKSSMGTNTLPDTATNETARVTELIIGDNCSLPQNFSAGHVGLKSLRFEGGVNLDIYCFQSCTGLEDVTFEGNGGIPDGLPNPEYWTYPAIIGNYAFYKCSSLNSIIIKGGAHLKTNALRDCTSLEMFIPESPVTLDSGVFNGCTNLRVINVKQLGVQQFNFLSYANGLSDLTKLFKAKFGGFIYRDGYDEEGHDTSVPSYYMGDCGLVAFDFPVLDYETSKTYIERFRNMSELRCLVFRGKKEKYKFGSSAEVYGLTKLTNATAFSNNGYTGSETFAELPILVENIPNKRRAVIKYKVAEIEKEIAVEVNIPEQDILSDKEDLQFDYLGGEENINLRVSSVVGAISSEVSDDSWITETNGNITVDMNYSTEDRWGWVLYKNNVGNYLLVSIRQESEFVYPIVPPSGLTYTLKDDGTYQVDSLSDSFSGETLIIPKEYNSIPVTSIKRTFLRIDGGGIKTVFIPRWIKEVEPGAFSYRGDLLDVYVQGGPLADFQFMNHSTITTVKLLDGAILGKSVFCGCTGITIAEIHKDVKWGDETFYDCTSLVNLYLQDGISTIPPFSFYNCTSLPSVYIPGSVETIGGHAFEKCSSIKKLTLSEGLKEIGPVAFSRCSSLLYLNTPESLEVIRINAFSSCWALKSVSLNKGLKTIENLAFSSCKAMVTLSLHEGLTSIGRYAFSNCSKLLEVEFPSTLESIDDFSFRDCLSLSRVLFKGNAVPEAEGTFLGTAVSEIYVYEDSEGWGATWDEIPIVRIPRN